MYKVFINDRPIFFCKNTEVTNDCNGTNSIILDQDELSFDVLRKINDRIQFSPLYLLCKKPKKILKSTFEDHKEIKAAGGIVKNAKGEILFIERLGKWDLPKGKIEKKETKKKAAIREIEEECGISNLIMKEKITETVHTYFMRNRNYIKTTYWYSLTYDGNEKLIPQTEEDISDVKWIDPGNISEQLSNTYESIKDVLQKYKG